MGSGVNIRYEPFKELVIMEAAKFSTPDDLARFAAIVAGGKPSGVYWADGIAFIYFPLTATTEAAAKELIEHRRVYWTFVGYAQLPKYQAQIETKEKIIVPVIDMMPNPFFKRVAGWLKQHL